MIIPYFIAAVRSPYEMIFGKKIKVFLFLFVPRYIEQCYFVRDIAMFVVRLSFKASKRRGCRVIEGRRGNVYLVSKL